MNAEGCFPSAVSKRLVVVVVGTGAVRIVTVLVVLGLEDVLTKFLRYTYGYFICGKHMSLKVHRSLSQCLCERGTTAFTNQEKEKNNV